MQCSDTHVHLIQQLDQAHAWLSNRNHRKMTNWANSLVAEMKVAKAAPHPLNEKLVGHVSEKASMVCDIIDGKNERAHVFEKFMALLSDEFSQNKVVRKRLLETEKMFKDFKTDLVKAREVAGGLS
jgi:uncharacterized membrane-anchored protein YhcB (DUF1043 family)